MTTTVTTHNSYWSRIKNSFWKILWGFILLICWIILLARNEKRFVERKEALEEWMSLVQEADITNIDPSLDGKLVHMYWETNSESPEIQDQDFWIITNDLKLQRNVEMFQWQQNSTETCTDNIGWSQDCRTSYDYKQTWSPYLIDSSSFHDVWYDNPESFKYDSYTTGKSNINLWVYRLSSVFTSMLSNYEPLDLTNQNITFPDINSQIINNTIYIWDPQNPTVWDLRISFSTVKTGTISVIGKQINNELTSYISSNEEPISLLEFGNISANDMFSIAKSENKSALWILRLVWLVVIFLGFISIFEFIQTLAKVLPFLSKIIWVWTNFIAFCLTIAIGFVTIWIAWLAVRPIIWISCLIVAIAGIILLSNAKKSKKAESEITNQPEIINQPKSN